MLYYIPLNGNIYSTECSDNFGLHLNRHYLFLFKERLCCGFLQCLIKAPLHEPQIEMKLNIHALVVMLLKGKVVVGITVKKSFDFSFFLFVSPAPPADKL